MMPGPWKMTEEKHFQHKPDSLQDLFDPSSPFNDEGKQVTAQNCFLILTPILLCMALLPHTRAMSNLFKECVLY